MKTKKPVKRKRSN